LKIRQVKFDEKNIKKRKRHRQGEKRPKARGQKQKGVRPFVLVFWANEIWV
jgi:hypothetical protein